MSKGDELNQLESDMGEMSDLDACLALKWLFEESLPMLELQVALNPKPWQRRPGIIND